MKSLTALLTDIKKYLVKHIEEQGVFNLIARLDFSLVQLKKEGGLEISERAQSEQIDEAYQVLELKQTASLLDIFILEYDFQQQKYAVIPLENQNVGLSVVAEPAALLNNRQAVLELIMGSLKDHCTQKEQTNSMTELHRLISNVPQSHPPLILPNYSEEESKYIYMYQSKECIEDAGRYYLIDRYFCFVTYGLAFDAVTELFKKLKNKTFEFRILATSDPSNVNWRQIKEALLGVRKNLLSISLDSKLQLSGPPTYDWVEKEFIYRVHSFVNSKLTSILIYSVYCCLAEKKLIFFVEKNMKHKLSELLLSIQISIRPLKYVYPIVLCSLNNHHCEFMQSPVPIMVGFWGSKNRCEKFAKHCETKFNSQNKEQEIMTTVIDLEKVKSIGFVNMSSDDSFIIEKLSSYLKKYGRGESLPIKINHFLREMLTDPNKCKSKSHWIEMLLAKIKQSQIYEVHSS